MEKQLIVGIDPGTSVGLAMLDMDGGALKIMSSRNLGVEEIITQIAMVGKAAVVATDKTVAPPVVVKVSSILGARLFSPDFDLPVEKKRELASRAETANDHERDSLAAAVYAYNHFQNKIRRIERQVLDELERTKARVLKGEKVSDIMAPPEAADATRELRAQLESVRKANRELRAQNESLLRAHPKQPHEALREMAGKAKELMKGVASGKLVILRDVPSLNFLDLKDITIRQGEYILCRSKESDGKGLRFLEGRRVGAIIAPVKLESLAPTCSTDDIDISSWEGLFFADPLNIEKSCGRRREVKARDLHDMLAEYKNGRR